MDITSLIIEYENGNLSEEKALELFQELVNSGLAWELQGSYGRTAKNLIEADLVYLPVANRLVI